MIEGFSPGRVFAPQTQAYVRLQRGTTRERAKRADRVGGGMTDRTETNEARRVTLSFPAALSDWGRDQISTDRYRGYFRRVLDAPSVGDVREEFVDVGCCGDSLDIEFRVERVEGGERVGENTTVEFVERDPDGSHEGGWLVQSAAAPE